MLFELMEYAVSKYGFINSMLVFLWFIFFISFVGVDLSYRHFNKNCTIGNAVITGYVYDSDGGGEQACVRLLDEDDDNSYMCRTFDATSDEKPVGSKVKVTYIKSKLGFGYDVRGVTYRGKNGVVIMFVLQLLPLLALIGLNVYSIFIDPSFQMI